MDFHRLAQQASAASGSSWAFLGVTFAFVLWAILGPLVRWHEAWLDIPTAILTWTTQGIVILVQYQNIVEARALHLKVDELIAVTTAARNTFIGLERQSPEAIEQACAEVQQQAREEQNEG